MKLTQMALVGVMGFSISACSIEDKNENVSVSYSYTENGCATGKQVFSGKSQAEAKEKMCKGLLDDKRNKSCASGMRAQRFDQDCQNSSVAKKLRSSGSGQKFDSPTRRGNGGQDRPSNSNPNVIARTLFENSFADGDQQWNPRTLALTYKIKDLSNGRVTTVQSICRSESKIQLLGSFPTVQFSLGEIKCDDPRGDVAIKTLRPLTNKLSYTAQLIPGAELQFRLKADRLPPLFSLPFNHQIADRAGEINAMINSRSVFMDFVITTQDDLFLDSREKIYLEIILDSFSTQRLDTIKVDYSHTMKEFETDITLEGIL